MSPCKFVDGSSSYIAKPRFPALNAVKVLWFERRSLIAPSCKPFDNFAPYLLRRLVGSEFDDNGITTRSVQNCTLSQATDFGAYPQQMSIGSRYHFPELSSRDTI